MPFKKFGKIKQAVAKVLAPKPKHASVAVKKYVKKVMDHAREDKYLDLSQTIAAGTVATDNAGSTVLLSGMSEGTAFNTRVGEVIQPKSLEVRIDCAAFVQDMEAGGTPNVPFDTNLRVIIFRDMQIRSSTLPTVADVLETVAYNAPHNHIGKNAGRFKILMDKMFELDPIQKGIVSTTNWAQSTNFTTQSYQRLHRKFKLSGKIVYTNSSTGTEKGNIYILYLSDQATATAPSINVYSRLIFEDA